MKLSDFPFKTSFTSIARAVTPKEEDEYLALASYKKMKSILADKQNINPDENPDLLFIGGPAFTPGVLNSNGDAIDGESGLIITPKFVNKYIDIEHKKETVVGNVLSYAYSEWGSDDKIIDESEIDPNKPYTSHLGGYVWSVINKNLNKLLIESSDPNSPKYGIASFSWEILFKKYDIAVGSKFVHEAEILTDEKKIKEMSKYLKKNDGPGKYKGENVYRVVRMPLIGTGVGLVRTPAAEVNPIKTLFDYMSEKEDDAANNDEEDSDASQEQESFSINTTENTDVEQLEAVASKSQNEKNSVNENTDNLKPKIKIMKKIKSFDDIVDFLEEKHPEESVASLAKNFIASELDRLSDEKGKEMAAEKEAKASVEKQLEEIKATKEELAKAKDELTAKVKELEEAQAAQAKKEKFKERMEILDSEFDFEDTDRQAIASSVRELEDEAFASWKKDFLEVIAKEKNKLYKKEKEEMAKKKAEAEKKKGDKDKEEEAKAAEEKQDEAATVEEAVASATSDETIVNGGSQGKQSILEKFSSAFSEENVDIK